MDDENNGNDSEDGHDEIVDSSPSRGKNKKRRDALRKAPQAPKRFKSSYICFFTAKQPDIKESIGDKATVSEISKRSAELWKGLSAGERAYWDDVAAKDKERYMHEKASYTGPWQVPWKRAKKDPSAPKRPMSAFLYFSQGKRTKLKQQHPDMKNTEVSRLLGEMWRNASDAEKLPHIEKEKAEREKYKVAIADWRKEADERQKALKIRAALPDWSVASDKVTQPVEPPAHSGSHVAHYNHGYHHPYPPPPGQYLYQLPPFPYPYTAGPYLYPPPPPGRGQPLLQPVIFGPGGVPHQYQMPDHGAPEEYREELTPGQNHGAFDYAESVESTE